MNQSRSSFVARVRKECNVMVRRFSNARIVRENQISEDQYSLVDFTFENLDIEAENVDFATEIIQDIKVSKVNVVAK